MSHEIAVLSATAASIAFFHTLFGPDHYLPFIVMSRSGEWSMRKTAVVTFLCGIGHVASSIVLGLVGIGLGIAVGKLQIFESVRGSIAAWLLIAFGLVYGIWGIRRAVKNKPHSHVHPHSDGEVHSHTHTHFTEHAHPHTKKRYTPWILFTIFVLGPCEPLIPLLMFPAAKSSISGMVTVTAIFAVITIATMLGIVLISTFGISFLPFRKMERYTHAIAGFTIFLSGAAIQLFGL